MVNESIILHYLPIGKSPLLGTISTIFEQSKYWLLTYGISKVP
jgi:hypothetical protein